VVAALQADAAKQEAVVQAFKVNSIPFPPHFFSYSQIVDQQHAWLAYGTIPPFSVSKLTLDLFPKNKMPWVQMNTTQLAMKVPISQAQEGSVIQ